MTNMRATTRTSVGDGSNARRNAEISPRTKKEPAKIHQARRVRRSEFSGDREVGRWGWLTSGIEDGGQGAARPCADPVPAGHRHWYFRTSRPVSARSGGRVLGFRGVVAALALDTVERLVGGGDELGGGPPIGGEGRHADRCADRDGTTLLADIGVVAECREDPFGGVGRF